MHGIIICGGYEMDTKVRNSRQYRWQMENRERINLLFPKGTRGDLEAVCAKLGVSKSEFVRQAIREKIDRLEK